MLRLQKTSVSNAACLTVQKLSLIAETLSSLPSFPVTAESQGSHYGYHARCSTRRHSRRARGTFYGEPGLHGFLAASNGIPNPAQITPGQLLTAYDPGHVHRVTPGETLAEIALTFYGDANVISGIVAANNIVDPNRIDAGQVLSIPEPAPLPAAAGSASDESGSSVGEAKAAGLPDGVLDNAAREVYMATLVPLDAPPIAGRDQADGLVKAVSINALQLEPGEVEKVRLHLKRVGARGKNPRARVRDQTLDRLATFEQPLIPVAEPVLKAAHIPSDELIEFIDELTRLRRGEVTRASDTAEETARAAIRFNAAVVASYALSLPQTTMPVGLLNLERIEMVPTGIERGELVTTIPLAPGERTAVTQKEWSVTSSEFTTIVTDELGELSETGVTDNTDLSQSRATANFPGATGWRVG